MFHVINFSSHLRKGQQFTKEWMEKHCKVMVIEEKDEIPKVEHVLRDVARFSGQYALDGQQVILGCKKPTTCCSHVLILVVSSHWFGASM